MSVHRIAVIPGDGTGPEVVDEIGSPVDAPGRAGAAAHDIDRRIRKDRVPSRSAGRSGMHADVTTTVPGGTCAMILSIRPGSPSSGGTP
jgi:hypothetical protein